MTRSTSRHHSIPGSQLASTEPSAPQVKKPLWRIWAFKIHSTVGIALALYMLIMSLSGVTLVFHDEISDVLSNVGTVEIGEEIRLDSAIASAKILYPDRNATWLHSSTQSNKPTEMWLEKPGMQRVSLLANQYTGAVIGPKKNSEPIAWLEGLHFNLLFGEVGGKANGFFAMFVCLLSISGVLVWWRGIRNVVRNLVFNSSMQSKAFVWKLHSVIGIWAAIPLLIWGVSGTFFCFPTEFKAALNFVLPTTQPTAVSAPAGTSGGRTLSVDEAMRRINRKYPGFRAVWLGLPSSTNSAYQLFLVPPGHDQIDEATQIEIDSRTGAITVKADPADATKGDVVLKWLSRLHMGNFAGALSKSFWIVLGLTPGLLGITGVWLWWRGVVRRRMR